MQFLRRSCVVVRERRCETICSFWRGARDQQVNVTVQNGACVNCVLPFLHRAGKTTSNGRALHAIEEYRGIFESELRFAPQLPIVRNVHDRSSRGHFRCLPIFQELPCMQRSRTMIPAGRWATRIRKLSG